MSGANTLDQVRIKDCLHHEILSCDPEAPIAELASIMSQHRVHALVLTHQSGRPAEIVSDNDVIAAAATGDGFTARDIAGTKAVSASSDSSLRDAARLMTEHGVSHLIARDPASGRPVGVLSTTDILAAYALAARPRT
jgi:CBS domain-containing protein